MDKTAPLGERIILFVNMLVIAEVEAARAVIITAYTREAPYYFIAHASPRQNGYASLGSAGIGSSLGFGCGEVVADCAGVYVLLLSADSMP